MTTKPTSERPSNHPFPVTSRRVRAMGEVRMMNESRILCDRLRCDQTLRIRM